MCYSNIILINKFKGKSMSSFGFGATLKIGTFTVSDMINISGPGISADTHDTTTHDTTNNYRTFIKGLVDSGEMTVDAYFDYDKNGYTSSELIATTTLQSVTLIMPTSPSRTIFTCNGHVTGMESATPIDNLIGNSITIKISGKPNIAKTV
jgi:hypothetical protein